MRHWGSEDDELKKIQEDLKRLEDKETLYGIIQNLKITLDMNDTVAEISRTLHTIVLDQKDEKVLAWLNFVDTSANHDLARKKHEPTTGNWFLKSQFSRVGNSNESLTLGMWNSRSRQDDPLFNNY